MNLNGSTIHSSLLLSTFGVLGAGAYLKGDILSILFLVITALSFLLTLAFLSRFFQNYRHVGMRLRCPHQKEIKNEDIIDHIKSHKTS